MININMKEIEALSKPLVVFTEKYIAKHEKIPDITLENTKSLAEVLSCIEKLLPIIKQTETKNISEDTLFTLWSFKELLLKTLVILLCVDRFYLILDEEGLAQRVQMIHDRLIVEFTNKALESEEVRNALNKGNIEEELNKRKDKIKLAEKRIIEIKKEVEKYNEKLEFFEQIPEMF